MVTIGRWGNALALRVPSHIAKAASLRSGMTANLRLRDDGSIVVRLAGEKAQRRAAVDSNGDANADQSTDVLEQW